MQATKEELLETVFSMLSVRRLYKYATLTSLQFTSKQRLVTTLQIAKTQVCAVVICTVCRFVKVS
jgi:hypothetical protein